jgi:membrane associated rhomboid family serine protease
MGQVGGVAFWAHIGGFLAGVGLIFIFKDPQLLRRRSELIAARAWGGQEGVP